MKRLCNKTVQVVKNNVDFPSQVTKTIFLGGPMFTEGVENVNWREEAVDILQQLGYDGVVYDPTNDTNKEWEEQTQWEHSHMDAADAIVFWMQRHKRPDYKMSGMVSNTEIGLYFNSNRLFMGAPNEATDNDYLQIICKDKYKWHDDLYELLKDVVDYIGDGVLRKDKEVLIPQHIFKSTQFQNWYQPQLSVGNYLIDFNMEYEFIMPRAKKLFLAIYKPSIYIKNEDRIKDLEFVISRTDMSYILAYKPNENIMDTELVICQEFRTPVNNSEEYIYELPGGSSLNEDDNELETASKELEEETGLSISADRFVKQDIKQSSATLCSHRIRLFSVELTDEEINNIKNDTSSHGVTEDTEVIFTHVMTVEEAIKYMDWTNIGMVLSILNN